MFRWLRLRMAISHALVLAVILIVLGGILQAQLARNLDSSATDQLKNVATGQANRIREAGTPVPPADSDIPSAAAIRVAVFTAPLGAMIGEATEVPAWLQRYPDEVTDTTVDGERVRVVTIPVQMGGVTVAWVSAGRSIAAEDRLIHTARLLLLLGGAAAVVVSLVAGWGLAGRAVRPVESAYQAQAGFAADASHELRTPLTFIRSGVEVLAEKDPQLGGEVLSEIDYLTGLTQRLLLLARAERGEVTLDRDPLDVGVVCRSAVHRSEKAHGNRLSVVTSDQMEAVGDRIGLEAILDTILENVKVHGEGTAEIGWIRTASEVVISVGDHGPGIPSEQADRAFERFFRLDPSRARETGGAGLGLSLAQTLAEAQGGRIWIEPTPGGGLTVRIGLPSV
jgi:signal transduction histidine kinase